MRLLCLFLDHVLLSTRVVGQQHLPRRGGVILAGNHTGLVDGPVVLGASPRGAHFIMKYSLGQGLGGRILRAGGQVPVDQNNGRQALKTCLGLLERGQVVGIFPEGARGDGSMSEIKAGVAWLAVNSRAPVVPFACLGTRHEGEAITKMPRLRRKIYVSFGAPVELDLDREAPAREQVAAALEQIGAAMRVQVERAVAASGIPLPQDTGRETKDD
ncbi:MAG: 1-acyl-sn-glycerol-3-phosphate acyltransferase [Bifidobacteriaceae bacterium]|nr:1-acyl-sn-glycerol-3-phosphate acyltransferase [Bifidobacteriaceae bacterium]